MQKTLPRFETSSFSLAKVRTYFDIPKRMSTPCRVQDLLMRLPSAPYTTFATNGLLASSVRPCPNRP